MPPTSRVHSWQPVPAAACAAAVALWLLLLVVSPYLVSHSRPGSAPFDAGGIVYLAGRVICHQRAERSFHAWGVQLPVCARCFGLYAGALLGSLWGTAVAARAGRRGLPKATGTDSDDPSRWPARLAIAGVPTAASIGLEIGRVWPQGPWIRSVAALPLGLAVGWFVAAHASEAFDRVRHGLRVRRAGL